MRRFVNTARRKGMTNGDFVFLFYALFPSDFILRPWEGDNEVTDEERKAYHVVKMVSL